MPDETAFALSAPNITRHADNAGRNELVGGGHNVAVVRQMREGPGSTYHQGPAIFSPRSTQALS